MENRKSKISQCRHLGRFGVRRLAAALSRKLASAARGSPRPIFYFLFALFLLCAVAAVSPPSAVAQTQNEEQILNSILDITHGAVNANVVATGSPGAPTTFYSADQIYNLIFDKTNNALKINCVAGCSGGGVTSVTGDGALLNNSLSTGPVTLTLSSAGGHTWFGNNTGSTATPGFKPIGIADLPAAVAQKPSSASPLCYASYYGSDSNDGLSWGTAKADIMACYDALPSGSGTIFVADGGGGNTPIPACKATDPAGCGIWIMGSGDPNFASPPAGWRKWGGTTEIIGVAGSCNSIGSKQPEVCVSAGGSDLTHPALWLSGAGWTAIKNLTFAGYVSLAYLGIDSNGSQSDANTGAWDILLDNDSFNSISGLAGIGPVMTITENSFWDTIQNCNFAVTAKEDVALTSCSWSSGTATCTASALPSSWTGTLNLGIAGVADASYDGLVSATVTSGTTFTYALASVVSNSTTGGIASSDLAQAILINPGSGTGVGAITIRDSYFGGGGIRAYGSDSLTVKSIYSEAAFAPIFHMIGSCSEYDVRVEDLYIADAITTVAGFRADQNSGCAATNIVSGATVDGPATMAGSTSIASFSHYLPDAVGEFGIQNNRLFAQTDSARRGFGPVATRFVNLASQTPSTWSTQFNSCPATLTAGTPTTAPDGTSNAGTVSIGSGLATACFASFTQTLSAGDWLIAGTWARSDDANGFYGNSAIALTCLHCGSLAVVVGEGSAIPGGGGEWDWVWDVAQIQVGYASDVVTFNGRADPTHPADFFAPVLLYIPAGTITTNEAVETALHLQSFRSDATAGQVSLLPGEQFKADSMVVGSGGVNGTAITSGATLARTIATGALALATNNISSSACQAVTAGSVNSAAASGVVTTDAIEASFNGDPTGVTGYEPTTNGMLTIIPYPTAGYVNFKVCNNTSSGITPGAITLNWRVTR